MTHNKNLLKSKTILIIGDIILDKYLFGSVERISPEAPVPILDVDIVSVSGKDKSGTNIIKQLQNKGINFFIKQNNDYNTIKTRLISNFQQIIRID